MVERPRIGVTGNGRRWAPSWWCTWLALRLAANQQADGRINYVMGFDEAAEDDISFKTEGVDVVMKPEYVPLLDQAVLDFVKLEEGDFQFIFLNPVDANYSAPNGD